MSKFEHEGQNTDRVSSASDPSTGEAAKADYQVGYKRPPRDTRFKPGQSGNRKGRPKGTPNHRTTVTKVMNEKVSVRVGDKTRRMTKLEAMVQAHANKGMKGDARSGTLIMNIMSRVGLVNDQQKTPGVNDQVKAPEVSFPQQSPEKCRPADPYFENGLDIARLSREEQIELSALADKLDEAGDLVRLRRVSRADAERFMDLIDKGHGVGT